MFRKIWKTGVVTKPLLFDEAPAGYRGKVVMEPQKCLDACTACVDACPAGSITLLDTGEGAGKAFQVSQASCITCGLCEEVCETKAIYLTNEYRLASRNKEDLTSVYHAGKRAGGPEQQESSYALTGRGN